MNKGKILPNHVRKSPRFVTNLSLNQKQVNTFDKYFEHPSHLFGIEKVKDGRKHGNVRMVRVSVPV